MLERIVRSALVALVASIALLGLAGSAAAQDGCQTRSCDNQEGSASTGPGGLNARVGAGGQPTFTSSGGSSNCVFFRPSEQTNVVITGIGAGEFGVFQAQDGIVVAWVGWVCSDFDDVGACVSLGLEGPQLPGAREARTADLDCDGDGVADTETGDALVEIGDPNELAAFAFDEIPWPELEIRTGMANPVSGFPIPLVLDDGAGTTFDTEFEAIAEDNGLSVTATATAREVAWFTGNINSYWQSRVGGDWPTDETLCTDFGRDLTAAPPPIWEVVPTEEEYGCVTAFRASSHTEPGERVTLESSVFYDVEYEVNLVGIVALGLPEWELAFVSEPIQVREIQSIVVTE